MSIKNEFIDYVEELMMGNNPKMTENVKRFWEGFKTESVGDEKPLFTDDGKLILQYLKDNTTTIMWKAKDIAEGLGVSSRKVSGSMRKLVTDGYVEKVGKDPSIYTLTDNGKNIVIN